MGRWVPDLLDHGLSRRPDELCVVQGDVRWTYAEVESRAARAVSALRNAGVDKGDRVALLAMNEPEFFELQIACQRLGAAFVPINFMLAPPEVEALLDDAKPRLFIHGIGFEQIARDAVAPQKWHLGEDGAGTAYSGLIDAAPEAPRGGIDAAGPSQLLYTSGTTGRAKGACVSNAALFARIAAFKGTIHITQDDVLLQALPLFHLASAVSYAFIASAATNVTIKQFDPKGALDAIQEDQITHALLVPTIIDLLTQTLDTSDHDLTSLRRVFYGASPIRPDLLQRAMTSFGCGFTQLYGMTEAGICVALEPSDHDPENRPGLLTAAGQDLAFCTTRILDPGGAELPPGEVGEISISSPGLLDGYWQPDGSVGEEPGVALRTGDAGYKDSDGYLFLTDRYKDMIITGGENVYSVEVETALAAHPAIAEVAVIGLPDEQWGQRVHALIVPAGDLPAEEELDQWCLERIARYKRPRSYEAVESLPRNALGKLLKHMLRGDREAG